MQPSALYNDFGALASLRLEARQDADAALETVASQFESLFLQMMLKSMRDAVPEGDLFNSNDMQTYRDMADRQMAADLSARGGIGLADVLVGQLRGGVVGTTAADAVPGSQKADAPGGAPAMPVPAASRLGVEPRELLRELGSANVAPGTLKKSSTWSLTS